jgi:uncharacterized damage-inducible protein DinB
MTITAIKRLLQRDLALLSKEIGLYKEEQKMWITAQQIANSAGNLCLHLVGNLNGFIGSVVGGTGYIRERDREFSEKNVPRETLLRLVADTATMVDTVLSNVDDSILEAEYPVQVWAEKETYGYFLIHLAGHLNYHLGQVNYHRRLLDA